MSCINSGRTRYDVTEGLDVKCTACLRLSAVGTRCTRRTRRKSDAERPNQRRAISDTHRGKIAIGERRGGENKGAEVEEEHQLSGRVRWVGGGAGEEPPRPQMNHARPNFVTPSPTALSPRRRLRSCPLMIMDRPCELISVAARPPRI